MPGITGFITADPDQDCAAAQLTRMVGAMRHEPQYRHGTYFARDLSCYVGWVGHEGSLADCNPIRSARGDVVLILSGEHFTHGAGETAASSDLRHGPHCGGSLLTLYEKLGDAFVSELNGWFSGILIDRRRPAVLLFNDRFGVSRLYYRETPEALFFASEAKALLSVRPETRALDRESLGHFLGFGAVFGNRTLFSNISLLPAGSCWVIDRPTSIRKRTYFRPDDWTGQPELEADRFYGRLRDTVAGIVPSYFRSSMPVGLSLTGGLDTRIVMAGMPANSGPMPSYTYAGVYRDCYDIGIAREVARTCGQRHHVLALGRDFFSNFGSLAERTVWVTDGCLDLCGTHEIYYSRMAKQLSPVRLTGNYGSEVLRSVSTFKYNAPRDTLFDSSAMRSTADANRAFAAIRSDHPVTFAAFQEIPWNLYGRLAAAQSQLTLRSPYMDNALVSLMYRAPANTRETNNTSRRLIADLNPRLASIPTDMGYGGDAPAPLAAVRRLYRYAQFKGEWYYNLGMPHWLASVERTLPLKMAEPLFLGSHKIDHYRLWFRDQLKPFIADVLADARSASRPYLNRLGFDELRRGHVSGGRNHVNDLNKVVTLELVHRQLIERNYGD